MHNVWTVKNHKKDIRNRRKKIWYDEDGNGSYYKRMQAYVQRNQKNTQNLDDRITKKKTGGRKMAQTEQKNQNVKKQFEELQSLLERAMALQTSMVLFEWDDETLAPKGAAEHTARVIGSLSEQYQEILASMRFKELLDVCQKAEKENAGVFDEVQSAILREAAEEQERLSCIPPEEYRAYAELTARATGIWTRAREKNDFASFAPVLKEIISYQKKFAAYRAKPGQKLYDVMLDTYEKGFNMEMLDPFFELMKGKIVPLLKESAERSKRVPDAFLSADYPEAAQAEAARFLAEYEGFDFDRGVLALSAHPFTTNLHNHDVRITTHYQKRIDSSIFSVLHETGHAIYEFGIRDDLTQTLVGQGTSMGMHECQSRFFENIVGRSHAFWKPIYGKVAQMFGSPLTETSLEDFLAAVNRTVPGLIRTEADELSYPLHVLVRYEIEKMLIEEELEVEKLPQIWNDKYEEYLGVRPSTDREGVLQDIHWSQGSIGYFPSYALGNAFGAQIYHQMKKELPVEKLLEAGNLGEIREYLRKNIHQYGKLKDSRQILRDMTGEDFNPSYYVAYLEEKYGRPEKVQ